MLTIFKGIGAWFKSLFKKIHERGKRTVAGLTPEVAKALKSTRDLIQSAKRDNSNFTDMVNDLAHENDGGIMDVADIAAENDGAITDLAEYVAELEARIEELESK